MGGVAPALAQTAWINPASGNWSTATNWSGGLPGPNIDALINATGATYTVSQSGGTINARTLSIASADATLALSGATLGLSTNASSAFSQGLLTLNGSVVTGAFTPGSGFVVLNTGGTSRVEIQDNNGTLRSTAGLLVVRPVNRTARSEWIYGLTSLIEADGASAGVGIGETFTDNSNLPWRNNGEIIARNGAQVSVGGTSTARLGTLRKFDTARINITGFIDNVGATLNAPNGGPFDIAGGSYVSGGSIAPGAIVMRPRIGSGVVGLHLKNGAVWEGNVAILDNSLRFDPGTTFSGSQLDASGFFGVTFVGPATVSGKTMTLSSTLPVTNSVNNTTFTVGSPIFSDVRTVTLDTDTVLRGNDFTLRCENNQSTLINRGTIQHLSGNSGTSAMGTLRNTGIIRADAGIFSLAPATLINEGIIESRAGVTLPLAVSTFTQTATGELRGAGQININGDIPGGTLRPGDGGPGNIGTLTIQKNISQPVAFTGPTTFAIEISAATADQLFFNNGSRGVDLSSGNVSLALTLIAPPTAQTYRIVNLPAGFQNLFVGTFAGLPHGSTVTANHLGTDYIFTVEYDTKGVTLRQVPANVNVSVVKAGAGSGSVVSLPAGIDCGVTCSADFATGTSVTLTATPAGNSIFVGWSGGCTGTGVQCTFNASASTVTANFAPATFNVTVGSGGSGTVTSMPAGLNCPSPGTCSASFAAGTMVTVIPTPDTNWVHGGYAGCPQPGVITGPCTFTVTGNTFMNSAFNRVAVNITVVKAGLGSGTVTSVQQGVIDCGSTCTASVPFGPSFALNAGVPDAGSIFTGFSGGGCSGSGPCTVDTGTDRTIVATFDSVAPIFTVTNTNASGAGSFDQILSTIYNAANDTCLSGLKTIGFNIPAATDPGCNAATGICVLDVPEMFNIRCGNLVIDGYTQPGASPNTATDTTNNAQIKIEFGGTGTTTARRILMGIAHGDRSAENVTVRGLAFPRHMLFVRAGGSGSVIFPGSGHVVSGNVFGFHADGTRATGVVSLGVNILGAFLSSLQIGGPAPADRNLITYRDAAACCEAVGRGITGEGVANSVFEGNYVNIGRDGLPVATVGVYQGIGVSGGLSGGTPYSANNIIRRNVIANVQGTPISTGGGVGNTVSENILYANPARIEGINFLEPASGGSNPQVRPVVTSATVSTSAIVVTGTVDADANGQVKLEFFGNAAAYEDIFGRAEVFLGSTTVAADGSGRATFTASLPPGKPHIAVTATRLSTGDTSKFSRYVAPTELIVFQSAVSRKTHGAAGTFDLPIDVAQVVTGPVTVESRGIGAGHTIVFQFDRAVSAVGGVNVVDGTNTPVTASAQISGSEVIVTIPTLADNKRVTVTLTGLTAIVPPVSLGFLVGDVNNSRSVNASDISAVKARSGQVTSAANFRFDVNASGAINASDISSVKARSGLALP